MSQELILDGDHEEMVATWIAESEVCPRCHGDGAGWDHPDACPECNGLGRVAMTAKAKGQRDPNYCSKCTPAGLGACRCEIASNE